MDAGRTVNYTYDALYRVKTALTNGSGSYPQWGLSWTYDRYGNRTAQSVTAGTGPSNSVSVDATTNRVTGAPYSHDANGNMANDGLNSLAYDAENRLVTSSGSTYTYDGKSLRVKKISGGTTTVYIFSGSKVVAEYVNGAAPASPTREYIHSGAQLVATIDSTGTKYHLPDHLSVRVTADASGNKLGEQGHYPFGESWYLSNTTTKWQFTTYERDSESGNDYAQARYYVNRLGRFSSPDPVGGSIGAPQSLNRFAYVLNNPMNFVDPLGLDCSVPSNSDPLMHCTATGPPPPPSPLELLWQTVCPYLIAGAIGIPRCFTRPIADMVSLGNWRQQLQEEQNGKDKRKSQPPVANQNRGPDVPLGPYAQAVARGAQLAAPVQYLIYGDIAIAAIPAAPGVAAVSASVYEATSLQAASHPEAVLAITQFLHGALTNGPIVPTLAGALGGAVRTLRFVSCQKYGVCFP